MRKTPQRKTIRRVIEEADRPLSASEVSELAAGRGEPVGIATVYRNLRRLVEEDWLRPVDLPGSETRYERSGKRHHHHFQCLECGRFYEVAGCPGNLGALTPEGFTLRGHELVLYGECEACGPEVGDVV